MGIGEFFRWWRSELAGMLPDAWRNRFERRHDFLVLTLEGEEVRVARRDNGHSEELGRISPLWPDADARMTSMLRGLNADSTRIEVRVPSEKMLVKQIQLPLAAEENLHQVLGFEMQRQTPFRAEQVYYNHKIKARDAKSQKLNVELSLVPRIVVTPVLDLLADWGLVPTPPERQSPKSRGPESNGRFFFSPGEIAQQSSNRLNRGLLALNLILLICVIAVPLVQQQGYIRNLRAHFDEVRAAAATASELRERIDAHQAQADYLFRHKAEQLTSVELLEELSRRLPDDTWLFRTEIRDGKVHLQGTSTRASALIAVLEDSKYFEDVRFASPVTQDGASGRERFYLSATVVSRPATADKSGSSDS